MKRCALALFAMLTFPVSARADEPPPDLTLEQAQGAINPDATKESSILPAAPLEAPPPPPYKKGFVLENSMGGMAMPFGSFGDIAPPAVFVRAQFGYEIFRAIMPFIEGELDFTDTSRAGDPSKTKAFPIYSFGTGVRFTFPMTPRTALYVNSDIGAMAADVPSNALTNLGFANAEALGFYAGGRLGFEWYQVDRHLALGLSGGARFAAGFAKTAGNSGVPLFLDGAFSLRYTF